MPAKAGIQNCFKLLDLGFRRGDENGFFWSFYIAIKVIHFRVEGFIKKMRKQPAVYLLASRRNGTLYLGVTSDLVKRVWEHKNNMIEGFTKRYGIHRLVWYELHDTMRSAIGREKRIKEWKRKWKLELIERINPDWEDLYHKII